MPARPRGICRTLRRRHVPDTDIVTLDGGDSHEGKVQLSGKPEYWLHSELRTVPNARKEMADMNGRLDSFDCVFCQQDNKEGCFPVCYWKCPTLKKYQRSFLFGRASKRLCRFGKRVPWTRGTMNDKIYNKEYEELLTIQFIWKGISRLVKNGISSKLNMYERWWILYIK